MGVSMGVSMVLSVLGPRSRPRDARADCASARPLEAPAGDRALIPDVDDGELPDDDWAWACELECELECEFECEVEAVRCTWLAERGG